MAGKDFARFGRVPVDSDLMLIALDLVAERLSGRKRDLDPLAVAAEAYSEFMALDDDPEPEALDDEAIEAIGALTIRLLALAKVIEAGRIGAGAYPPEAVAEAACAAPLIQADGEPSFQLLDFLARVERASEAWR